MNILSLLSFALDLYINSMRCDVLLVCLISWFVLGSYFLSHYLCHHGWCLFGIWLELFLPCSCIPSLSIFLALPLIPTLSLYFSLRLYLFLYFQSETFTCQFCARCHAHPNVAHFAETCSQAYEIRIQFRNKVL